MHYRANPLPICFPRSLIWRSMTYCRKTNSCISPLDISISIWGVSLQKGLNAFWIESESVQSARCFMVRIQISSFTPSYRTRKLIEDPSYICMYLCMYVVCMPSLQPASFELVSWNLNQQVYIWLSQNVFSKLF